MFTIIVLYNLLLYICRAHMYTSKHEHLARHVVCNELILFIVWSWNSIIVIVWFYRLFIVIAFLHHRRKRRRCDDAIVHNMTLSRLHSLNVIDKMNLCHLTVPLNQLVSNGLESWLNSSAVSYHALTFLSGD